MTATAGYVLGSYRSWLTEGDGQIRERLERLGAERTVREDRVRLIESFEAVVIEAAVKVAFDVAAMPVDDVGGVVDRVVQVFQDGRAGRGPLA